LNPFFGHTLQAPGKAVAAQCKQLKLKPGDVAAMAGMTAKSLSRFSVAAALNGARASNWPEYHPEVLAYFKSTGDGWQSLMDSVLRQYVASHSRGG
jgi:hypothetical protein